jgi:hypothetical protein
VEHGPNFLEPPPDLIEGQPKWEVEAIVGMRHFGPKKKKQYRVHWKGYSNTEDTWEPEDNIHAPELMVQYQRSQENNIRTSTMETKSDMIQASHLAPPGESSSFPKILPSPISEITNPELAEAYAKLRADSTVPEVTLKLAKLTQHSEMKLQDPPLEVGTTRTILDLGIQTQGDHTQYHTEFRPTYNRSVTPHP